MPPDETDKPPIELVSKTPQAGMIEEELEARDAALVKRLSRIWPPDWPELPTLQVLYLGKEVVELPVDPEQLAIVREFEAYLDSLDAGGDWDRQTKARTQRSKLWPWGRKKK